MSAKASRFPHSLVLIFGMIVVAQLVSYLIPAGTFDRLPDPANPAREMVVAGSYQTNEQRHAANPSIEEAKPLPWHASLTLIPKGMEKGQEIIFLVFIVGGVIAVIRATGAIDAMIGSAIRRLGGRPVLLVTGMLALFAVGSSTIGMAEEYMPFIPILVAMCLALKMDAIVAMGIVYIGAGIGYGCAAHNPFTVVIAKGIAEQPLDEGVLLRWGLLALMVAIGAHHILRYAKRLRDDPSRSLVAHVDYSTGYEMPDDVKVTGPRALIVGLFVAMIGVFVWGVDAQGWYIVELEAMFLGLAIVSAAVARLSPNRVAEVFCKGAAEMTTTALLIGFARTIEQVLVEAQVIDTVVNYIAETLPSQSSLAATGMLFVQSICNLFIPSGSGQAYVTMPIMTPLADLTGTGRETAVLAYQFGDGLTNMIVPTNALLMGMLAMGRIPFVSWLKFILPLLIKLYVVAIIVLVIAASQQW
ncbi:MAG: short-chain fatty acid transporter [Planctomycetes bacterium]|nr:short-chain fatty acid transporter [Planctomycetota bacterium]